MRTEYLHVANSELSIRRRCILLNINRSNIYYAKKPESNLNIELKHHIEDIWSERNNKGSRTIAADLRVYDNIVVNRKHVQRLMRMLDIAGIIPKSNLSKLGDAQYKYPYCLSGMHIYMSNLVWVTDITYCKLPTGMMYVIVILDLFSRKVLAYEITNTLDADNCICCLNKAMAIYGKPVIFNSNQGSQFTCHEWVDTLNQHGIIISMDGKGRWVDNVYMERFWRTLKYECIFLFGVEAVFELKDEVGKYIPYYNTRRLHSSLGYQTPDSVYNVSIAGNNELLLYCEFPPIKERTKIQRKRVLPTICAVATC